MATLSSTKVGVQNRDSSRFDRIKTESHVDYAGQLLEILDLREVIDKK